MRRSRIVILLAMFFVASDRLTAATSEVSPDYSHYADQIIAMARLSPGSVTLKGLWTASDFDALASKASVHVGDCIRFVSDASHDYFEKRLAIYAMYKLPVKSYVAFVRQLLVLYDHREASKDELLEAIDPEPNVVPRLIFDNYDDPDVQALLKDIAARPVWDQIEKSELARLMDGGGLEYRLKTRFHAIMRRLGLN